MSITHNWLETGGKKPTVAEIEKGEIAINFVDQMIWTKDHNGTVISVGGGTAGLGGASSEDIIYQLLLDNSSYSDAFYDILGDTDNIASNNAVYSVTKNNLTGVDTNVMTTTDVLSGSDGSNYWDFLVYFVNPEETITVEYSLNNSTWIALPEDKRIILDGAGSGSATLYLRYSWTGSGVLESYGVLYNESGLTFSSNTKLFAKRTLTSDIAANTNMVIPSGKSYDNDGKSLMLYVNRLRMFIDTDYEEVDNKTVKWLIDLHDNDTIVFEQQEGYVDVSNANKDRLDMEHDVNGYHVLTDTVTAINYRVTIEDGNIVLVEQ